jgi:hypothetical protein
MPPQYSRAIQCLKSLTGMGTFENAARSIGQFKKHTEEAEIRLNDGVLWVVVRSESDLTGPFSIWVNDLGQRERVERYKME